MVDGRMNGYIVSRWTCSVLKEQTRQSIYTSFFSFGQICLKEYEVKLLIEKYTYLRIWCGKRAGKLINLCTRIETNVHRWRGIWPRGRICAVVSLAENDVQIVVVVGDVFILPFRPAKYVPRQLFPRRIVLAVAARDASGRTLRQRAWSGADAGAAADAVRATGTAVGIQIVPVHRSDELQC